MKLSGRALFSIIIILLILLIGYNLNFSDKNITGKNDLTIGEKFHVETGQSLLGSIKKILQTKSIKAPPMYKNYSSSEKIKLPVPDHQGPAFETSLKKRRSIRNFKSAGISLQELSQLLFAAQGITGKMYGKNLRTAPSGGALYPIELYVVINNVTGIEKGIYHYSVIDHSLELIKKGDHTDQVTDASFKQEMAGEASVTFIMTAIFARITSKYGDRGYRYAYIECGHISQNIYLQSTSLGLGSVCIGAFSDSDVNSLLEIDGRNEAAIYLHSVGRI